MFFAVFICFWMVIAFDAYLLNKQNNHFLAFLFSSFSKPIFKNLFFILIVFVFVNLFYLEEKADLFAFFTSAVLMPLYLLRRQKYIKLQDRVSSSLQESIASKTVLMSDALGVVMVWFFSAIVFSVFIKMGTYFIADYETGLEELVLSAIFSSVIALYLIKKAAKRFSDKGFWVSLAIVKGKNSLWRIVVVPALIGLTFAFISATIITNRGDQPQTPLGDIMEGAQSPVTIVLFLMLAIIFAPFIEEVIFRGYFFHVLKVVRGRMFAVFAISLSFAALHFAQYWGDWAAILIVTALGFALTILRDQTGSTIAGIVTHYVYNAGVTIIPVVMLVMGNPSYFKYQSQYSSLSYQEKEGLLIDSEIAKTANILPRTTFKT